MKKVSKHLRKVNLWKLKYDNFLLLVLIHNFTSKI